MPEATLAWQPVYSQCTSTRSKATGEQYITYRLVNSERLDSKVKQVTLLNLGRHFAVDPTLWPAVCRRATELMAGQASFLAPALPKAAAREAERIAARLLAQQALVYPSPAPATVEIHRPMVRLPLQIRLTNCSGMRVWRSVFVDRNTTTLTNRPRKIIIRIKGQVSRYARTYYHELGDSAALVDQVMRVFLSRFKPHAHSWRKDEFAIIGY